MGLWAILVQFQSGSLSRSVQELRCELAIQKIRPAGREATRQLQHQLLVSAAVGDLCVTSKSMTEGISTDGAFPTGNLIFDASGNLYGTTFAGAGRALLRQLR